MDRRNGGTSLAPPRPPKSLPRVHRPRAPEPANSTANIVTTPPPASTPTNPPAMMPDTRMLRGSGNGGTATAAAAGGIHHQPPTPTSTPPQLSPKPRHLIGGSGSNSASVLSSSTSSISNGNSISSNVASNISSNGNNNMNINSNNNNINNINNNTIFVSNNHPHNQTNLLAGSSGGGSNFSNTASLISSNGISNNSSSSSSSRSSSNSSSSSTSTGTSASSRSNCNLINNNSVSNSNSNRSGSVSQPPPHPHPAPQPQPHLHHHHHHHHHPHQQSNRSIGSNSSTLSSVSSSSSTVALLRPQIAPLVPLHTRSSTPPPPPLPPHQRPTSPAGSSSNSSSSSSSSSTFARRRLSPVHHLTSIPLGPASGTTAPMLLLPIDQPIAGVASPHPNSVASNPTTPVTLAAPRPENERLANEYVDTPFGRTNGPPGTGANIIPSTATATTTTTTGGVTGGPAIVLPPTGTGTGGQQRNLATLMAGDGIADRGNVITGQPTRTAGLGDRSMVRSSPGGDIIRVVKSTGTPVAGNGGQLTLSDANAIGRSGSSIITKQPTKKKDGSDRHELLELELHHHHHHHRHHGHSGVATVGGPGGGGTLGGAGSDGFPIIGVGSITCPRCRRCRCEECLKPRPLPSHWLCDKSCLCSAETIIDYASCLCCVKALYYHCSKEHEFEREIVGPDGGTETETVSCADDPCSCVPHKRTTRWGCLGALSLALPCLWCYWPMRGCVAICARCYAKHSRHGCRCTQHPGSGPSTGFPSAGGASVGIVGGGGALGPGNGGTGNAGSRGDGGRDGSRGKSTDPVDGTDSPLHHLHHHLRHHLHRSGAGTTGTDLTTPEKRLLDSSTDAY